MNETIKNTLQKLVDNIESDKRQKKYVSSLFILQSFSFTDAQNRDLKTLKKQIKKNQNKINTIIKGL